MTQKNRTLEGKNRTLGGVKNRQKSSDIIYVRSLRVSTNESIIMFKKISINHTVQSYNGVMRVCT